MTSELLQNQSLGLLGAGNMAEALARGVLAAKVIAPGKVIASDLSNERRELFSKSLNVRTTVDNAEVVRNATLIVLCVKPQQVDSVLREIRPVLEPNRQILASICAGVNSGRIESNLPEQSRVVRVMPNTPMLVGLGASCICAGRHATARDVETIAALFSSGSITLHVEEKMMDAVTGLSGSGPAYLFFLVEAMIDAGVAEGFSREDATTLAVRTVLGASKMLEDTKLPPEELRRRVTSPNGTTQAAIELLESNGVKAKLTAAVRRAAERSRELGR